MKRIIALVICCFLLQGSTFVIDAATNASMHNNKGVIFLHEGNYLDAISEFKIAVLLLPNKPVSACYYNNLGLAYNTIHYYDWAQNCFERAIAINPNFFDYYQNLVKSYRYRKTLKQNLIIYKNSKNSISYLFRGLIYEEMGKKKEAGNMFIKYTKLEPDIILTNAVNKHLQKYNKK
jgi:tetratricopeptide (TPR) repeat protein